MAHAFAANDRACHFHTALLTNHTLIADSLIFPAETLEVLRRSEDTLAEEAVRLRTLGAIVHGFGFGYFSAGPGEDIVWACNGERDCVEGIGCGRGRLHTGE